MTLGDVRDLVRLALRQDLTSWRVTESGLSDASVDADVNRAYDRLARWVMPYFPRVTMLTATATYSYDLEKVPSRRMLKVVTVSYLDQPLLDFTGRPGLWTSEQLLAAGITYAMTAGVPKAASTDGAGLAIFPLSDQVYTVQLAGAGYWARLVASDQVLEAPACVLEVLPFLAAQMAAEPLVSEGEALERLSMYKAGAVAEVTALANTNRRKIGEKPISVYQASMATPSDQGQQS